VISHNVLDAVFESTPRNRSNNFPIDIVPASWTFDVWSAIYSWQALHLLYGLTLIFRKAFGDYIYTNPSPVSPGFYFLFIISSLSNTGWLFTSVRGNLIGSLFMSIINRFALFGCIVISHRDLCRTGSSMLSRGLFKDIWAIRLLIHNGVAFYAAWGSVAVLISFNTVLVYEGSVQRLTGTWLILALLNVIILGVFFLEVCVFDRYARYTIAHYITLVIALSGIMDRHFSVSKPYTIYVAVILGLTILLGVIKGILMLYRHRKLPMYAQEDNIKSSELTVVSHH